MDPRIDEIRARLAPLAPESVEIEDQSARHAGHAGAAGGGGHYHLIIVAAAFEGLPPIQRHRKIYALVGDLIPERVHALSIDAYTPKELG